MNIVNVRLPAGKIKCAYGATGLGVNEDNSVDVPKYVAKTLVAAGGACDDPLTGSVASLLAASNDESGEQNYLFWAHHQPLGDNAAAQDLLTARGEPSVAFT